MRYLRAIFFLFPSLLCLPTLIVGAATDHYYLHISSFRKEKNAVQDARALQQKGYKTVIKGGEVADMGYWYRVYVGPFYSLQEARSKRTKLQKTGFTYVGIHKKKSVFKTEAKKKAEVKGAPAPTRKEKISVKPKPPASAPPEDKEKPPAKTGKRSPKRNGRNIRQGSVGLGLRHTYRKVYTEITERKQVTSDGVTTTVVDVVLADNEKDDFPTTVHMDTLRIRFGLTDYLEIFADFGMDYHKEFSDPDFVYGGGFRLNLFEAGDGLYAALQGGYLGGKVEHEYTSDAGNKWEKEADWHEFTGKAELGIARRHVAAYIGGVYLLYREDAERRQLENVPAIYTSRMFQDELKEKNRYGAYGGAEFHLGPSLLIVIEGQVGNQRIISAGLEYYF